MRIFFIPTTKPSFNKNFLPDLGIEKLDPKYKCILKVNINFKFKR